MVDKRALSLLSLGYWTIFIVAAELHPIVPDGAGYLSYAMAMLLQGDLAIVGVLQRLNAWDFFAVTSLGYVRNVFAMGTGLLWLPFVALAHSVTWLASLPGVVPTSYLPRDAGGVQYLYGVTLGTAVYGYAALCLSYACARRFVSSGASLAGVSLIAVGTPFSYYSLLGANTSHVPSAFCIALLLYCRTRVLGDVERPMAWGALLLGMCSGLCVLVRWELAFVAVVVGLELTLRAGRSKNVEIARLALLWRRSVPPLAFGLGAVLVFSPQLVVFWRTYGTAFVLPHGEGFLRPLEPQLAALLVSSHHGFYTWSPALIPATVGLFWLYRRGAWCESVLMASMLLTQVYVAAIVEDVHAGASFGARRLVSLTPIFAIGMAVFVDRAPRWLSAVLSLASLSWTLLLLLAFKWQVLSQFAFATWHDLLVALARTLRLLPDRFGRELNPHLEALELMAARGIEAWPLAVGALFTGGIIAALVFRMTSRRAFDVRAATWLWPVVAILCLCGVTAAALRTEPARVPARAVGNDLLLDFGNYANSRYDSNPYRANLKAFSRFPDISGSYQWNGVPFEIRNPAGGRQQQFSVATVCGARPPEIRLPLPSVQASALHLALVAHSSARGGAVANIDVVLQDGRALHQVLTTKDVRDIFDVVPDRRVVARSAFGAVQGYSIPIGGVPREIRITRAPTGGNGCISVFAVTQANASGSRFAIVDLAPAANANHAIDFFLPEPKANFFPDLAPGIMQGAGHSFALLAQSYGITSGTTLTTSGISDYAQLLPLQKVASRQLLLLLDGYGLRPANAPIAQLSVEYTHGAPTTARLMAGKHVRNYEDAAAEPVVWNGTPPQDLSMFSLALDPARIPRHLWIRATHVEGSFAIFALTQHIAR